MQGRAFQSEASDAALRAVVCSTQDTSITVTVKVESTVPLDAEYSLFLLANDVTCASTSTTPPHQHPS